MMKIRYGILSILSMLFVILINSTMVSQVMASEITLPQEYYFVINGQNRKAGTEYELKQPELCSVLQLEHGNQKQRFNGCHHSQMLSILRQHLRIEFY